MVDTLHPIYVPSKGRADGSPTAALLTAEDIPYTFVVEPDDTTSYTDAYPQADVLTLPESNRGLYYSRNWIKQYSREQGQKRHWQFDDDVEQILKFSRGKRSHVATAPTLELLGEWADRYTNLAIAGMMYQTYGFRIPGPFSLNKGVASAVLVDNGTPYEWRDVGVEDFDYCLQVLTGGDCTVLWHLFQIDVVPSRSNVQEGGVGWNAASRREAARTLQRYWPGLVKLREPSRGRYSGFSVGHVWRKFDQPLIHA